MRHALKSALRVLGGIVVVVYNREVDSESQAADSPPAPTDCVPTRGLIGTRERLYVTTVMGKCLDILRLPLLLPLACPSYIPLTHYLTITIL